MRSPSTAAVGLLALAGCAPLDGAGTFDGPSSGVERGAIVGGTTDSADPEVFMMMMEYDNNTGSGCTGTLIASRTLLTASHCVDPRIANATSVQIWVTDKTDSNAISFSDLISVTETRMHPGWDPAVGLSDDVALALLAKAPAGVTPKQWNTASLSGLAGQPLRAVGYGTTGAAGNGSGVKRTVDLTFRQLTSDHIKLGDLSGKGVCHGDSGGPSFHTFADGVERQVGIHSYTNNTECTDGADTRVDAYATFINQWLSDKEGPQCAHDGKCKAGCTPYDVDCYCVADGVCNTQCPTLTEDPDCPKDCVANGVCSIDPCPVPDTDCVAAGSGCSSELQCVGRQCVSDPQHPDFYCSKNCQTSTDCPTGMTCPAGGGICRYPTLPGADPGQPCTLGQTFCTGGTFVCSGAPGWATACVRSCQSNGDCPTPQTCEDGQNGYKFCRGQALAPILLTRATTEGAAAATCTQAGGSPAAWAVALAALWVASKRRRPHLRRARA